MSDQTYGDRMKDAAKKRREYLLKKTKAYTYAAIAAGICMACIVYLCSPAAAYVAGYDAIPDPSRAELLYTFIAYGFLFIGPTSPSFLAYTGPAILTLTAILTTILVSVACCWKQLGVAGRTVLQDAAKSRSEYYWTKAETTTKAVVCGLVCLFSTTLFVLSIYRAFYDWHPYFAYPNKDHDIFDETYHDHVIGSVPNIIGYLIIAIAGFVGARAGVRKVIRLPYIPPVCEQIAALPADEVLLRGSDQPAALPGELLRAAQEGTMETAPELLLRPMDNGTT